MKTKPFIYLAGPYSHKLKKIMHLRGKLHCQAAAKLLEEGYLIYSPIAETMNLAKYGNIDGAWDTWREKDLRQLSIHDEMWILPIDGWKQSKGLRGEIKFCIKNKIPMYMINLEQGLITPTSPLVLLEQLEVDSVEDLND